MSGETGNINVLINGSRQAVPFGTTLEDLILKFKLQKKSVAIEYNHQVADRTTYAAIQLNEADQVEIVHFVGGG